MKRRGQSSAISENIAAVANLEQEFLRRRSGMDRLVDEVADFTGSLTFVAAHGVWFAAWFIMNAVDFAGIPHFDPKCVWLL